MGTCLIGRGDPPSFAAMHPELEEGDRLALDFDKIAKVAAAVPGVVPAVAQDVDTGLVLMLGYVNRAALDEALARGVAVFWSTSRDELWVKGATSGDLLELIEARVNCEQNSILYLVRPRGEGACHTRGEDGRHRPSCYYRVIEKGGLRHAPVRADWRK
jgi:phosphoribosyl-AMP cyclohydrolase